MTAHGVDRVAADKAQTYCPRLEGLAPWFFGKASCPDTYELLNSLIFSPAGIAGFTHSGIFRLSIACCHFLVASLPKISELSAPTTNHAPALSSASSWPGDHPA
jgi:hypothetical protein